MHNRPISEGNGATLKNLKIRLNQLWKQEETYWGQRAKMHWLKDGNHNSKFFHLSIIGRRARNHIVKIRDTSGEWLEH